MLVDRKMANSSSAAVVCLTQTLRDNWSCWVGKKKCYIQFKWDEIMVCIDHNNNDVGTSVGAKWHVSFRDKTKMLGKKSQLIRHLKQMERRNISTPLLKRKPAAFKLSIYREIVSNHIMKKTTAL